MSKRNVIQLSTRDLEAKKKKEYERFLIYELPTLEVNACIQHAFYSPERYSIAELREVERKALDKLAYVHSKLPPEEAERFIKKCVPFWKVMRTLHKMIYDLAIKDLEEQGIDPRKEGIA